MPQLPPNPDGSEPQQPRQPTYPTIPALNVKATILLKHVSNVWRLLDLPFINCEKELD